jgi:nudix-type nucleoside diphosphatase (YffH/AdpP family)
MAKITINSTKILSDEHYTLKRIDFGIEKKDGSCEQQQREVFDHGNAATALLYNKAEQTILLTRQFRIATYVNGNTSGMLLETPAGLLEEGEDPADSIIREIKEETGYEVKQVQKVYEAYTSGGSLTELLYMYVAEYTRDQKVAEGGGLEEEGEEITVVEIPFAEAVQKLEQGQIKDAKTIMLLQYALIKDLLNA